MGTEGVGSQEKMEVPGLTYEQWKLLMKMLNGQKDNTNEQMPGTGTWIIDNGASKHMTGNLGLLCELQNSQGCPVGLPHGKRTNVLYVPKLTNVLYVLKLNCNLISVSQLTDEAKCIVQFTNELCCVGQRFEDGDWCGREKRWALVFP
ncbi:hypothetical protein L6164_008613 [Bauhinia variegata]|uniref:Uncharacterized protein n=1 Tax=Bauhinia variegata TaxID=167791 RepID=A0ACB9PG47_BAUVA|nr:hypothetical protein L6164_008613 [Bauhinia variegata]